MEQAILNKN